MIELSVFPQKYVRNVNWNVTFKNHISTILILKKANKQK